MVESTAEARRCLDMSYAATPEEAVGVSDATAEEQLAFSSLPFEVLVSVGAALLPSNGFAAPPTSWHDAVYFISTSRLTHAAMLEAMRERMHVPSVGPRALCALVRSLLCGGESKWKAVRPLRAVRAQTPYSVPMQAPPRLSGGSLCALAPGRLCLFGGRDSASGDTLSGTRLVTLRSSVAIWDDIVCDVHPEARCYHTAVVWNGAPRSRMESAPMVVFGGAGEGESGHENLLDDVWSATMAASASAGAGPTTATEPPLSWRQLKPGGTSPAARSSHISAGWPTRRALILHGGLSTDGVLGDTWLLQPNPTCSDGCEWVEMQTSGATVKRAHHAGGLVGDSTLLVFSGQDATLITQHTLCALHLDTAVWSSVALPTDGPCWSTRRQAHSGSHCGAPIARIDGAGAHVAGVGLVIFGGVGDDFGFVPAADAWLLRGAGDVRPPKRLALPKSPPPPPVDGDGAARGPSAPPDVGPCARACLGLCADGLALHLFGGFDGEADLDDLWTLDLQPPSSGGASSTAGAFDVDVFKARQARATAVLHATAGAAGHNSIGMPIHVLVGMAARGPACVDAAATAGRGTLPPVGTTPSTADAATRQPDHASYDLRTGLGDGLSRGQRAAVLAAFRDP